MCTAAHASTPPQPGVPVSPTALTFSEGVMRYTASRLGSGSRRLLMSSTTCGGKTGIMGRALSQAGLLHTPGWMSRGHWMPHGSPSISKTSPATHPCPQRSWSIPAHPIPALWSLLELWAPGQVPGAMDLPLGFSSHPPWPEDEALAVPDKTPPSPTPPSTQPGISFSFPSVAGSYLVIRLIKTNTWSPPPTEGLPGDKVFWLLQPQQARRDLWNSSLAPGAIHGRWGGGVAPSQVG